MSNDFQTESCGQACFAVRGAGPDSARVKEYFGSFSAGSAAGLRLRHNLDANAFGRAVIDGSKDGDCACDGKQLMLAHPSQNTLLFPETCDHQREPHRPPHKSIMQPNSLSETPKFWTVRHPHKAQLTGPAVVVRLRKLHAAHCEACPATCKNSLLRFHPNSYWGIRFALIEAVRKWIHPSVGPSHLRQIEISLPW